MRQVLLVKPEDLGMVEDELSEIAKYVDKVVAGADHLPPRSGRNLLFDDDTYTAYIKGSLLTKTDEKKVFLASQVPLAAGNPTRRAWIEEPDRMLSPLTAPSPHLTDDLLIRGSTTIQPLLESMDRKIGAFSADELLPLFRDFAFGLADLHDQELIHKDLHPGNLCQDLVTGKGVLIDFDACGDARLETSERYGLHDNKLPPELFVEADSMATDRDRFYERTDVRRAHFDFPEGYEERFTFEEEGRDKKKLHYTKASDVYTLGESMKAMLEPAPRITPDLSDLLSEMMHLDPLLRPTARQAALKLAGLMRHLKA